MADIQIVLVEADQPTRVTLRTALRSQDGLEVASEATNGETELVLLESIDVDVAVVNANLPDMDLMTFVQNMRTLQTESYVTSSKMLVLIPTNDVGNWPPIWRQVRMATVLPMHPLSSWRKLYGK
jgi:anaerobic magnesium-protoporphyrin IX monomethyl ester cyclase